MAHCLTTFSPRRKKNLLVTASAAVALGIGVAGAQPTTFDFTNDAGGDLWMNPGNWNQGPNLPNTGDVARIPSSLSNHGSHKAIFITNGAPGVGTLATVGTLVINTPKSIYTAFHASDAGFEPNPVTPARLTFGTTDAGGGFVLDMTVEDVESPHLDVGFNPETNGTLTFAVPRKLALQVASDNRLALHPLIEGAGSVTLAKIGSGTLDARVAMGSFNGASSTFSGGFTLGAGVTLDVFGSAPLSGGTVSYGPLGTGTVTLAGGTANFQIGSGTQTLGNAVVLSGDSRIIGATTDASHTFQLTGSLALNNGTTAHTLTIDPSQGRILFNNTGFSSSDTGTLAIAGGTVSNVEFLVGSGTTSTFGGGLVVGGSAVRKSGAGTLVLNGVKLSATDTGTFSISAGTLQIDVSSGNTGTWGGHIGVLTSGTVSGALAKTGAGTFSGKRVRVADLNVGSGMLQVGTTTNSGTHSGGDNSGAATSFVNTLTIGSGAKFDLANNELIVDYSGATPIATVNGYLANGFASGSWNGGGGINSSAASGSGSFTIGIGDTANSNVGSMIFSGIQTDSTALVIGYTYYGDANMSGETTIADQSILGSNYNTSGKYWYEGDFNYDGNVNIGDFALLANNYNGTDVLARGLPPLAELYVAILDHPSIYWEAKFTPSIWRLFEPFESMNLGDPPPVPAYLLARGIPEPAAGVAVAVAGAFVAGVRPPGCGGEVISCAM